MVVIFSVFGIIFGMASVGVQVQQHTNPITVNYWIKIIIIHFFFLIYLKVGSSDIVHENQRVRWSWLRCRRLRNLVRISLHRSRSPGPLLFIQSSESVNINVLKMPLFIFEYLIVLIKIKFKFGQFDVDGVHGWHCSMRGPCGLHSVRLDGRFRLYVRLQRLPLYFLL